MSHHTPASLLVAAMLSACAAPDLAISTPTEPTAVSSARTTEPASATETPLWSFKAAAPGLRERSCPNGEPYTRAQSIDITATPVELGPASRLDEALNGATFVGGWALSSEEPNFGGLSGLAAYPSGTLLAVSDAGAFVWINMDADADFAPGGTGSIAYMRGEDGTLLDGKASADAEGLAMRDGLALVSFERDHRVLAFDLEGCGGAARGTLVARPSAKGADQLANNRGMEALTLQGDHLLAGSERKNGGLTASFGLARGEAAKASFDLEHALLTRPALLLTGFDALGETLFAVERDYKPLLGNTVSIRRHVASENGVLSNAETLVTLSRPLAVDNFEAIVAVGRDDGGTRVIILSDDNFSDTQQTLLFAFDVDTPPE